MRFPDLLQDLNKLRDRVAVLEAEIKHVHKEFVKVYEALNAVAPQDIRPMLRPLTTDEVIVDADQPTLF